MTILTFYDNLLRNLGIKEYGKITSFLIKHNGSGGLSKKCV